jgi:hypothetical protein
VKTAVGEITVQIVYSSWRGSWSIEHLGSTHDDGELETLNAAARLAAVNLGRLLGLLRLAAGDHLDADGKSMGWLCRAYDVLGFGKATHGSVIDMTARIERRQVVDRMIDEFAEQSSPPGVKRQFSDSVTTAIVDEFGTVQASEAS